MVLLAFTNSANSKSCSREHMASDMRDEDLLFWTGQGESSAGFFVAEVDGSPVGTVAYLIKVCV